MSIVCIKLKFIAFPPLPSPCFFGHISLRCPCTGSTCPCVAHHDVGPSAPERPCENPGWLCPKMCSLPNGCLTWQLLIECPCPLPTSTNANDQCSTMPVFQSQTAVAPSGMSQQFMPHCLIRKREMCIITCLLYN